MNSKHWWAQIQNMGINAKYNVFIDTKYFSKSRKNRENLIYFRKKSGIFIVGVI